MRTRKKFNIFHVLVLACSMYFIVAGLAITAVVFYQKERRPITSMLGAILMDRKIGYHWLNSLFGVFVLVGFGYVVKVTGINPTAQLLKSCYWLGLPAVAGCLVTGFLATGAGVVIFLIHKGRIFKKPPKEETLFQFEEVGAAHEAALPAEN